MPLVGRDPEQSLLRGIYERAVRDASVQLVTIVGVPGIGKSRLVAERLDDLGTRPEPVTWRQGRCLPYGDGITFWALGEIVKAQAGILESIAAERPAVLVFEDLHWAGGAARLPRAPGRLVAGRAAAGGVHGPAGAVRAPARLGRRQAQRDHGQPRPLDRRPTRRSHASAWPSGSWAPASRPSASPSSSVP